jgi:hypothetical protein
MLHTVGFFQQPLGTVDKTIELFLLILGLGWAVFG